MRLTASTWLLLLLALSLCCGAELVATISLERVSTLHKRMTREEREAEILRPAAPGTPKTILLVGNSLLLEGVDFPRLRREISPYFAAHRYIVEASSYYDWYYGLRRLFHCGMKPDYVALCLNPPQLLSDNIMGEFAAHYMFDLKDIWPVSRAIKADSTTTAGLYTAHFSTFYGTRSILRGVLMGKIAPAVARLWLHLGWSTATIPDDSRLTAASIPRLNTLRQLCDSHGVHFVFLSPTTQQNGDLAVASAGRQVGVRVLRPLPNGALGPEYYQEDGFHLNAHGASLFTSALARALGELSDVGHK